MSYMRPEGLAADLQFSGVEYARPQGNEASFGQGSVQFVMTVGVGLGEVGAPLLRKQYERIDPAGAELLAVGWPAVRDPTRYARPHGLAAHFATTGLPYTRPDGLSADFGPKSLTPTIYPAGHDAPSFGTPEAWNHSKRVAVGAIPPTNGYGWTDVRLYTRYLQLGGASPAGISSASIGRPSVINWYKQAHPPGFDVSVYGRPLVFNLRQYLRPTAFVAHAYGSAFVQGGVKHVALAGYHASAYGRPVLVNTTAEQSARPLGIAPFALGRPGVSPRTLWPAPIYATGSGFPRVQFPPQPRGWQSGTFGYPSIRDKAHYARGEGFDAYVTGYAVVRDRAQKVLHHSAIVTSVFGDVAARLQNARVMPAGLDALETSSFAEVRSNRRYLQAVGVPAPAAGAADVRNKTPSLAPLGWPSTTFGPQHIGWRVRRINAAGVAAPLAQVALPSLWQTPGLRPAGIPTPAVAQPMVGLGRRTVSTAGRDALLSGVPTIGFKYRFVVLEGAAKEAALYGLPRLEHGTRTLLAFGALRDGYGTPWVSRSPRFIEPQGVPQPIDRSTPMVGGRRWLYPDGYDAARFGTRIVPERQSLYPLGFVGSYGLAQVLNVRRYLRPAGITTYQQPQDHWGRAAAWNSRQYVSMEFDPDSGLNAPAWPQWTAVENRNRIIGATGMAMARMGSPFVENGARALLPVGFAQPAFAGAKLVADRIRPLFMDGLEPPYIARWTTIANNAAVLRAAGAQASLFGQASLESNRRVISRAGAVDVFAPGNAFIAPRVRGIETISRYAIAPPYIPLPSVQLLTRYVELASGIEPKEAGRAALQIIWRGLTPRWTHRDTFGEPRLRNVTPELGARGWVAEEFGDTGVRLEWRAVAVVQGGSADVFGRTRISDKTQRITFAGDNMMRVGDRLKVERFGVQPPGLQTITVTNGDPQENFIDMRFQVPKPSLNQHVIYVQQEQPHTAWGNARIDSNGILAQGYWEYLIGEPFVSLKRRELKVGKFPDAEVFEPSRPRMSPLTIWAVMEAPEQAERIQPVQNKHYINGHSYPIKTGEIFGGAVVTLKNRKLAPNSGNDYSSWGRVGQPALHNKRQYVVAGGLNAGRFGWPTVPGTRFLKVDDPPASLVFGRATVAPPPYTGPQTVAGRGASTAVFGRPTIELRDRKLSCTGWASLVMGARLYGDTPYAWRGLRVGELMPTIPMGFESEAFGASWVSLRVRDVQPEGTDMFLCEYDYKKFDQRMRVRNAQSMEPPIQRITTNGHQSSVCGWQEAKPMRHYIRPDGNSNQHRKGAPVA